MRTFLLLALITAAPSQQAILDHLAERVDVYKTTLPSLVCEESIQTALGKRGKLKPDQTVRATLRVTRPPDGGKLSETLTFLEQNGKPVTDQKKVQFHVFLSGGFSQGLTAYLGRSVQPCFTYQLEQTPTTLILHFQSPETPSNPACTDTAPGILGLARIDPATLEVTHIERTVPNTSTFTRHLAAFAAVDYAPIALGDQTFYLPIRVEGADTQPEAHFLASYTNFHRYTASATITPGDPIPSQ